MGVTKVAWDHHFPSKLELGPPRLDEVIGDFTDARRQKPIAGNGDPIVAIIVSVREAAKSDFEFGPPAQQPGAGDVNCGPGVPPPALQRSTVPWESGVAAALARCQKQDLVRKDVDVDQAATFVVASIEGAYGLAQEPPGLPAPPRVRRGVGAISPLPARTAPKPREALGPAGFLSVVSSSGSDAHQLAACVPKPRIMSAPKAPAKKEEPSTIVSLRNVFRLKFSGTAR